jgi:ribosomal protein S18 acetylase RimI-like enzyme
MKKVIPFQRNDFDAVKKLLIEGFSNKFKNDINENFFLLNNYGFVIKEDEKLLGFASIHVINKINRVSCLIEDVVIDSNYRGKGLGKLLINHLIKFSKSLDSDKIILNSKESNTKFYEKLGFKKNETQMIIRL